MDDIGQGFVKPLKRKRPTSPTIETQRILNKSTGSLLELIEASFINCYSFKILLSKITMVKQ